MKSHDCSLRVIIRMGMFLLIISGCDKNGKPDQAIWKTDASQLEKRLPLLAPIESCVWKWDTTNYSGRGLPAPEDQRLYGYVRISNANKHRILQDYDWQSTQIDTTELTKPVSSSLADQFFSTQDFKQSDDLMRDHAEKVRLFRNGVIIFNPKTNVLYFDLYSI